MEILEQWNDESSNFKPGILSKYQATFTSGEQKPMPQKATSRRLLSDEKETFIGGMNDLNLEDQDETIRKFDIEGIKETHQNTEEVDPTWMKDVPAVPFQRINAMLFATELNVPEIPQFIHTTLQSWKELFSSESNIHSIVNKIQILTNKVKSSLKVFELLEISIALSSRSKITL